MHFNLQLQQQRQEPNNWHPRQQWRTTMVLGAVRCCWNCTLLFGMIILELLSQLTSQLTSQLASQFLHFPLQLMSSCGRVAAFWGNLAKFRTNVVWLPAKCCSNKHDLQILLLLELFIFHIVVSGVVVVIVAAGAWQCSNDANHVNIHFGYYWISLHWQRFFVRKSAYIYQAVANEKWANGTGALQKRASHSQKNGTGNKFFF